MFIVVMYSYFGVFGFFYC